MLRKLAIAASAALLSTAAYAQQAPVLDKTSNATVNLSGQLDAFCQISFSALPAGGTGALSDITGESIDRTIDLTVGRTTNQPLGDLNHRCNAPYSLTIQSEHGGMCNTTIDAACNFQARPYQRYPYGVNFNGSTTAQNGANGLDQFELRQTVGTPFEIANYGWNSIANLTGSQDLNVEVDLGVGGVTGLQLAGAYEDTLTFVVDTTL